MITTPDQVDTRYLDARPQPQVSLSSFRSRIKGALKYLEAGVPEPQVADALYLDSSTYRKRYGTRKTHVTVDGKKLLLSQVYESIQTPAVSYRTFWQRVKRLQGDGLLDNSTLEQAATLETNHWITMFGGGRRRRFKYEGVEFPEQFGTEFSSVTAFLRAIARYDDRQTIWSRLKRGWPLDEAIVEPVVPLDDRTGQIYMAICAATAKKYIGLTVMSLHQRWRHHVRVAVENNAGTPLAKAIRKFGGSSFSIEVLESNLDQEQLPIREKFWIKKMDTMKPRGLNASPGGQMGGGKGRTVDYEGEAFRSMESAAAALSERTGLARHVIVRRLSRGEPLPDSARTMSKHPEAGTNLWRRWKSLMNSTRAGRRVGSICARWENYDNFAADVKDGYQTDLRLVRKDDSKPWSKDNFQWVSKQVAVEKVHGETYEIDGQVFGSLASVARAYGLRPTTLKYRVKEKGLSVEEAVRQPLSSTSKYARTEPIVLDEKQFDSENQAAKYASERYGLTFHQARDRIRRKKPLVEQNHRNT